MSLGVFGPLQPAYASVIGELAARGVLVVVSAGNEGGPVGSPANCTGAAAVTGLRHAGTKVGFASLGPQVAVGAPGGNCVNVGRRPVPVLDRHDVQHRHAGAGRAQLHESNQHERRHELLGADRLRHRGAHGRRERQSRRGAADRATCAKARRRRSRSRSTRRFRSVTCRRGRTICSVRVQLHDEHLRCRHGERGGCHGRGDCGRSQRCRRLVRSPQGRT